MAVASSKKPAWAEDIEDFGPSPSVKVRHYNCYTVFMEMMAEWYQSLSPQKKRSLVKRELVARAKGQCRKIKIRYEELPKSWLRTLHNDYKVTFKYVPKAEKYKKIAHKLLCRAVVLDKITSAAMKKKLAEMRKGAIDPQCLVDETKALIRSCTNGGNGNDEVRMVDLTDEPPPVWWMEAYAQGQNVKRTLHTSFTKDKKTIVLYYHYAKGEEGEQNFVDLFPIPTDYSDRRDRITVSKKVPFKAVSYVKQKHAQGLSK